MTIDAALVAFAEATRDDLSRLLMAASRTVNEKVLAEVDPEGASGVRLAHVPVIAALDPGGTRMGDLAPRIGVTRQAVAALTKDLDALGVVVCEPDPRDGRATIVRLTEKGAAFCESAVAAMTRREAQLASTLGTEELDRLRSVLRYLAGDATPTR